MTLLAEQLTFDLPCRPAMAREDFLVAACNAQAVDWLDAWPKWAAIGLVVYGENASGKTHLARVWQEKTGADYLSPLSFQHMSGSPLDLRLRGEDSVKHVIIDNADQIKDEEALFHLYNHLFHRKGSLLLTAQKPPKQWDIQLKDWQSRLLSLPSVEIQRPDEEILTAVFMKQMHDRQMLVDLDVIQYIVPRSERSFKAISAIVEALDEASLRHKRRITVPLARNVLARISC